MKDQGKLKLANIALLLGGAIFGGAFLLMVYFMSLISENMGAMTAYMEGMYVDIHSMHDHIAIMVSEVSKIDDVIIHMDENMNAMSNEVTLIENSISDELRTLDNSVTSIAISLLHMDAKVGNISVDVNRMSGMIGGVTYDVHRGTQSFTSPMGYMWNMMP
jgi:methyl-accepting chemotaxis protein